MSGLDKLYRREGSIDVCRGCGAVREGTASFAISHQNNCRHIQLYSAFIRLFDCSLDATHTEMITEIVLLTLGEKVVSDPHASVLTKGAP
jgi:hypothetical protein